MGTNGQNTAVEVVARLLVSAGDASGDAIAAALVRVLRDRHPEWTFSGMAGPEMSAAGVERVTDPAALAVGGFAELLPSAGAIVGMTLSPDGFKPYQAVRLMTTRRMTTPFTG